MTTVVTCIPDDLLPAFLEGKLPDDDSLVYEEHLLNCTHCLERTRAHRSSDTVAVVKPVVFPNDHSPAAEALMKRLVNLDASPIETDPSQDIAATEALTVRSASEAAVETTSPHPVSASSDLYAGDVLGPYRILSKLGQGGMGAVYKATHSKLDKVVALKVLSSQVTRLSDAVTRFEREMRAVGKLEHPHIVRAMDAGEIGGVHYLAMEYVDGIDLQVLVKSRGCFSVVNACKAIRQSAMALVAAHGAGLVHRDIKPSNLLLGKNGQIKLLDLGLALLADDVHTSADLTTAGQSFGTPDYMAPEQWEDAHAADTRTDLYALGCTLFFLLVGRAPYATEQYRTAVGKMKGHVTGTIPSLRAARADVPEPVAAIYERLLAKSPSDRFQTAAELVEALTPFVTTKASAVPARERTTESASPATDNFQTLSTATDDRPLPARRTTGQTRPPRRPLLILAAAASAAMLLAVIVITITNRNGSKTTVEVAGDAAQIDVIQDGKPLVKVSPPDASSRVSRWEGWPAGTPKPAIAPFAADDAAKLQEAWAAYLEVPVEYTNSVGMKFRLIPPGEFKRGTTAVEVNQMLRDSDPNDPRLHQILHSEAPQHDVILSQPIYLGTYEVTQAEYEKVIGTNPAYFGPQGEGKDLVVDLMTGDHPVETVSWDEAAQFCVLLSELEKRTPFDVRTATSIEPSAGIGYRLPSEAEWEFACRAGASTKYWSGDSDDDVVRVGWSGPNAGGRTHAVGQLPANPFGLHDIHGNVWEWVLDGWEARQYDQFRKQPAVNPCNLSTRSLRVQRGGDWFNFPRASRSAIREASEASRHHRIIGFRVALPVQSVSVHQPPPPP